MDKDNFDEIKVMESIQKLRVLSALMMATQTENAIPLPKGTLFGLGTQITDVCNDLENNIFN